MGEEQKEVTKEDKIIGLKAYLQGIPTTMKEQRLMIEEVLKALENL
jgi:hypothetical protein